MNRIEISGLTKRFGDVTALDGISLTLEEGKIYGLLGRNGAGKSTLLNVLTNRIFADSGDVRINGMPAKENDTAQSLMYMMSEKGHYPPSMKVSDVFKWTNVFYDGALDIDRKSVV